MPLQCKLKSDSEYLIMGNSIKSSTELPQESFELIIRGGSFLLLVGGKSKQILVFHRLINYQYVFKYIHSNTYTEIPKEPYKYNFFLPL